MQKKKLGILLISVLILTISFFIVFGFYRIEKSDNKNDICLVRKIKNHNMNFNIFKPNASSFIKTGDMVAFKSPELFDPPFHKRKNKKSRIIAKPGEVFSLRNGEVFIDDIPLIENYSLYFLYRISMNEPTNFADILNGYDLEIIEILNEGKACNFLATEDVFKDVEDNLDFLSIRRIHDRSDWADRNVFPKDNIVWNKDNFGSIMIPFKGQRVAFNAVTVSVYKKIIDVYEGHSFHVTGNKVYIDNELVTDYVIEKNYYFVLNDNRYELNDSRSWGFIPEDFIIGKIIN